MNRVPTYGPPSFGPVKTKAYRDAEYNRSRRDPELLKLYGTSAWKKFRSSIRAERALCEWCSAKGLTVEGDHVHHKVDPRDDPDGLFDPANVELLCKPCHSAHHGYGRRRGGTQEATDVARLVPTYRASRDETPAPRGKLTLAIDFGGVIHSYSSGWMGVDVVADPPVPGAIEFLLEAVKSFKVCIVSSRFRDPATRNVAMSVVVDWLARYGVPRSMVSCEPATGGMIVLCSSKPKCHLFMDDRGYRFEGTFPPVADLLAMQPWNRKG